MQNIQKYQQQIIENKKWNQINSKTKNTNIFKQKKKLALLFSNIIANLFIIMMFKMFVNCLITVNSID